MSFRIRKNFCFRWVEIAVWLKFGCCYLCVGSASCCGDCPPAGHARRGRESRHRRMKRNHVARAWRVRRHVSSSGIFIPSRVR